MKRRKRRFSSRFFSPMRRICTRSVITWFQGNIAPMKPWFAVFLFAVSGLAQAPNFAPVTDRMLENPDPADWLMWRRTLNSWGYSPLNQINRGNATSLQLVWTRGMGMGVQEATPLVYKGMMYLPNPSDDTQAIDAATGDLVWEYRRPVPEDLSKWLLGAPLKNRNLAIYGDT